MADNKGKVEQRNLVISKMETEFAEVMNGTNYDGLLEVIGRFPEYSLENHVLILKDKPGAQFLATYDDFKDLYGRQVIRGAKSLGLLTQVPVKSIYEVEAIDRDTGKFLLNEHGRPIINRMEIEEMERRVLRVFDVSQTTGNELTGSYFEAETLIKAIESIRHITFTHKNLNEGLSAYNRESRTIEVQQDLDAKDMARELLHRIAHDAANQLDIRTDRSNSFIRNTGFTEHEMIAESAAYALISRYRLDTSHFQFDNAPDWLQNKDRAEFKNTMYQIEKVVRDLSNTIDLRARSLEQTQSIDKTDQQMPDLMVRTTNWEGEYSYKIVKGMYREGLKEILNDFAELVSHNQAEGLGDYFRENHIEFDEVTYKDAEGERLSIRKYDFEYIRHEHKIIDPQEALNQRLDIAETDVVLMITGSMGTDVGYAVIKNKDKAQVKALMEKYMELVDKGENGSEYEFLESEGVESDYIEVIEEDEIGYMDLYYGDEHLNYYYEDDQFYDLSYDIDGNEITDSNELEIVRQAKYIMQRLEYKEILFSRAEVDAIIMYAQECGDLDKAKDVINRIAAEEPATLIDINKKWLEEMGVNPYHDIIIKFSYGMSDYGSVYKRISNSGRQEIGQLLKRVVEEVEGELDNEISSFLAEHGVQMETILDENGNVARNIRTYDFACDFACDFDYDEVMDMQRMFEERKPVQESDVVVKFLAGEGISVSYQKIENMEREEVHGLLEKLVGSVKEGYEGHGIDFLLEHGAEMEDLLENWTDNTINGELFYDYEYNVDSNVIRDRRLLPYREQAEQLINRMEHTELLFSDQERAALLDYAENTPDIGEFIVMAKAIAAGNPDMIRNENTQGQQEESHESLAVEPGDKIEITSEEAPLVYGHDDYFGIYQLRQGEELRDYRFESLANLQERGLAVERRNYDLVYQAALKEETLDDIFERFNIDRPEDFKGHSLSVSNIVVFRREGETHAHYVDRFGFQEVNDFYRQTEKETEKTEIAYDLGDKYIAMQASEEGYDYSLYDREYVLLDGGVLENPELTIKAAAREITTDLYGETNLEEVSYDALLEWADRRNAVRPEQNRDTEAGDVQQSISFYVAENGEFHSAGEYHDSLTLQEAIAVYHTIPSDRMNAGKAIGFELQTGMEGVFSEISMELFYFNTIGMDNVEHIESIRGNALVWEAMKELADAFPDAEIDNRETIERLAVDLIDLIKEVDPYEYRNNVADEQEGIRELVGLLTANSPKIEWDGLDELLEENAADEELINQAKVLKQRIEAAWLGRQQNPLNKVEELVESNYNQIDGILNNISPPEEELKGSIHTRLEKAREILAKSQETQDAKPASKRREELEN